MFKWSGNFSIKMNIISSMFTVNITMFDEAGLVYYTVCQHVGIDDLVL